MKKTQQEAARTRLDIIAAAECVMSEMGYAEATLAGIADSARVTRGAVHHHFSSKAELLHFVLAEAIANYLRPSRAASANWKDLAAIELATLSWLDRMTKDAAIRRQLTIIERTTFVGDIASIGKTIQTTELLLRADLVDAIKAVSLWKGLAATWSSISAAQAAFLMMQAIRRDVTLADFGACDHRYCIQGLFASMSAEPKKQLTCLH
ncbi:TetR family transcriptional regulator [Rhizobium panacihumi]|uniref:TetR family transcriptional regulator n=1 Tax=Rhizobium panacihumi TaxID=2008450 RepID=UPI003D7B5239